MVKPARDPKGMKLKTVGSSVWRKIYAHRLIIAIIAGVVLLVAVYAFWSKYTWDEYETRYTGWHSSTRGQVGDAFALPATTDKERNNKLSALKKASDAIITAKSSLCSVNNLVGWQRFIGALHNREKKCQEMMGAAATFAEKTKGAIGYLESEKALTAIISSIPSQKPELVESDWAAQAAAWHAAAGKVDTLAANANFAPVKQVAQITTKKIDAAWQEIIAANAAKDKARYLKAQSQLADSYGTLGDITGVSTKQLKTLLDPLQLAYKAAF